MTATPPTAPAGELLIYTDSNGATHLQVRLMDDTVWLSQALIATLYGKIVRTINKYLLNILRDGELDPGATIRNFRMVQMDCSREVSREFAPPLGRNALNKREPRTFAEICYTLLSKLISDVYESPKQNKR